MAGGYVASADDGPADLAQVPNKRFIMLVAAFSAMGGLLFGYDTGINGGVKVSKDFILAFCVNQYSDEVSKCSCYGHGYEWRLAGQKRTVAENAWSIGTDGLLDNIASANDQICVVKDPDTGEETNYWACDCFAPDANREPSGWLRDKGLFVSLLSFGAMTGALSAGQLSEILGRRKTISIVSAVFVLGTLICCVAGSFTTLLVGRVLIGFPIGALSAVLPMYATEIAPKQIRGLLGTLFQLAIVLGILLATIIAIPVEEMVNGWIFALGIAAIPAGALSLGIWRFPESPRWLLVHADESAASTALQTLRAQSAEEVGPELREMQEAIANAPKTSGYKDLLEPRILHRLLLGVGLQILQQATGVNAIFYFAPTIFKDAKIHNALFCAAATGLANLGGQLLAMRLVEEKGRRTLLLWGAAGMAVCMGIAGVLLIGETGGFTGYLAVFFVCLFIINFAYSWGPMCWVYPAEIFPMHVKSKAVSITTCGNWVTNMVFGYYTPIWLAAFGPSGLFCIFAVFGVICYVFVLRLIPETRGVSLEQMDQLFEDFQHNQRGRKLNESTKSGGDGLLMPQQAPPGHAPL